MARKIIDIGAIGNDGTGDSIRDSFRKVNDNFRELYSSLGLGEKLTFRNLEDTPNSYAGQENAVVSVNQTETGLIFKQLVPGTGIQFDFTSNPLEIGISTIFSEISGDPTPQLGGDLSARSGGSQWRILDLSTPIFQTEAATKGYVDTKIGRGGTTSIDPRTNAVNPDFGVMTGPLILSRDPEPDDDETYNGLVAATKRYVDSSAFGSSVNLYVAVSGKDERPGVSSAVQGRALAYAYRTFEAALKRAEELVLESRVEIGPYKKVLTYGNGAGECYLANITEAPGGGAGFAGTIYMSVSGVEISSVGNNYRPGDIITIAGGAFTEACRIEILTTTSLPGGVLTFRVISTGVYSALPGSSGVATTSNSAFGNGAAFDLTYSVNNIVIDSVGSGYGLVSVRIVGGGGSGAFGSADVVNGEIAGITITDKGTGFTSLPNLVVNLPRFKIFTDGARTDFTGDVTDNSAQAIRSRDIREGLFLRGERSGALAQILSHSGQLDGDDEIFDVDIQFGAFELTEPISYGDITKNIQITVLVESGLYEENFPLRVPQNVAIVGDEFRRCIVKPKKGVSSSPWALLHFRRDDEIDGNVRGATNLNLLAPAGQPFGYHYLHDPSQPCYPLINNPGNYRAAADLLTLNKTFIAAEVIGFINDRKLKNISPFSNTFDYDQNICQRDVGLLIDSMAFDLKYGGQDRTISAALKYYGNASGLIAITTQLSQTLAAIERINVLAQDILLNNPIDESLQGTYSQIIDRAFVTETGAPAVFESLVNAVKDVIDGSGAVNYPEENDKMDAFLMNDAVIVRAVTIQGHGGFSMVLDPTGQVLAKSPYIQEAASFSRSIGKKKFTGGMFVDGFSGNLEFKIYQKLSNTRLLVNSLKREPKLPASFIVDDQVYRINYVRDYIFDPAGSTAQFVLDETTPWPFDVFTYNSSICRRDVGLIIDGLGYDILFDTNYNARKAGLLYREANAEVVITTQKILTVRSIAYAHELAGAVVTSSSAATTATTRSSNAITKIINNGVSFAPAVAFTNPPGVGVDVANAKIQILNNLLYIKEDCMGWILAQIADGSVTLFPPSYSYNSNAYNRRFEAILLAVVYDSLYGGNSQSRDIGLQFYNGVGDAVAFQFDVSEKDELVAAVGRLKYVTQQVLQNLNPTVAYTTITRFSGTVVGGTTITAISALFDIVISIINDVGAAPVEALPSPSAFGYDPARVSARTTLLASKTSIQDDTIDYITANANKFEVLMPGNRSMLSNDFTQVADMGYGLVTTNGGLTEAVSMFTYYCQISYYSINGGQIRSIGGSSAHGVYGLVAEGADPLEVPVPVTLYHDFSQGASIYSPTIAYPATQGNLYLFVEYDDYVPLNKSELEVDHREFATFSGTITGTSLNVVTMTTGELKVGDTVYANGIDPVRITGFGTGSGGVGTYTLASSRTFTLGSLYGSGYTGSIVKYPVTSVTTTDLPAGVAKINLGTASAAAGASGVVEGLFATLPDGFRVTVRALSQIVLTGDVVSVTTRPSTGLVLDEAPIVYRILEFETYNDLRTCTISVASEAVITTVLPHEQQPGSPVKFTVTDFGALPTGISSTLVYYILTSGFTPNSFKISTERDGTPVATTGAGSGTFTFNTYGLARTTLRENYDYVDFTTLAYQPFRGSLVNFTVDYPSNPTFVNSAGHGLVQGTTIRLSTTGNLPGGSSILKHYFVHNVLDANRFEISATIGEGSIPVSFTTLGTGTHSYGRVIGERGDSTFAVQSLSTLDRNRVLDSVFTWKGTVHEILNYTPPTTLTPYGIVEIDPPLADDVITYTAQISHKASVKKDSGGNLTIRIALTRVTSHDLLEIGTGSYADTNYPNEIYGPSVNPATDANETQERGVGRTFYVTTDQFGNFRVGPYFRVDQGTGNVTFSAAITLSNLDGFGFKRGVPVSEFSTDDSMSDNATDTVPTEQAVRTYIERRLGLTHAGNIVTPSALIPEDVGGFVALNGLLSMKADLLMGNGIQNYKIQNLDNPINPTDAVNLRSLTFNNFQEVTLNNINAGDILTFTGAGRQAINAALVGDVTYGFDSTANTVTASINPGVIGNTQINAGAAISQSKLNLNAAGTRTTAVGITQADRGLSSFDDVQFTVTNGWVTIKNNGIALNKVQQLASRTVVGNSNIATADATAVPFNTVVDLGGGIKKSQYVSTGILRRRGFVATGDSDYEILETTAQNDPDTIVKRDSQGDFAARIVTVSSIKSSTNVVLDIETSATGGFVQIHGFNGTTGLLIGDGTTTADRTTYYDNDRHIFRSQNRLSLAPITASQLTAQSITTGSDTTIGTITGQWILASTPGVTNNRGNSRMQATYAADLAEFYEGDKEYDAGTVLVFGGEKEVTISTEEFDYRVAGVVSDDAAYSMYGACPGFKNQIALQGRVPCKVVGKVKKGDLIVTSKIPGVAMSARHNAPSGTIIGKSLEDYDSDHIGTIEVAVGRT
jgi:hypothetical protein